MKEIWKDVKEFEQFYEVSSFGRVRSKDRIDRWGRIRAGRILSTKTNNRGYIQVHLNIDSITTMKLIHRIVAEAFIENRDNLPQVNHINENKEDNRVENLEWCTNLYNRHYGDGIKAMAENRNYKEISKNKYRKIDQLDLDGNKIKTWDCISQIKRETNINDTSISFCVRGKQNTAGGYRWRYAS